MAFLPNLTMVSAERHVDRLTGIQVDIPTDIQIHIHRDIQKDIGDVTTSSPKITRKKIEYFCCLDSLVSTMFSTAYIYLRVNQISYPNK